MFSRWDFGRSAEAAFSQWAMKRVCKFLLKKRLGDFILGDIDLNQLDVQLTRGTIQLTDLALNADYLNQKLAGAAVMVKEGSLASLSIKIPWKLQNCQIEVEELELVLAPFVEANMTGNAAIPSDDCKQSIRNDPEKSGPDPIPEGSGSVTLDIHEGVKTIAKIVKWFLTSFHVRIKKLIVAFDPCKNVDEMRSDFHRSLVLRIAEIEYGTCVSEDATTIPDSKNDCFLGKGKLTNFVKFQGAVLEFLKMDDVDNGPQLHGCLGTSFSEWHTGKPPSCSTSTILTGASDGFSGRLNLSIPWKNGSLDIRKVDADFFVDPVELSLQPSTIKWIIVVWDSLKSVGTTSRSHVNNKAADSVSSNSRLNSNLSMPSPEIVKPIRGSLSKTIYSSISEEMSPEALLPRTHVIHNWVPLSINEEVQTELEKDYGVSIDQFFECFDGMRSSQANSGNSGIWNWTCSVFSAITVASNLASGSGHIPIEQQNVETSLRATISDVAVSLFFHDEEHNHSYDLMDGGKQLNDPHRAGHGNLSTSNMINLHLNGQSSDSFMSCISSLNIEHPSITEVRSANSFIHHVEARCQNLVLNLQICPQKMKFEASVMHFMVNEYHDRRQHAEKFDFSDGNNSCDQLLLNHNLQGAVLGVLPPFRFPEKKCDLGTSGKDNAQRCQDGMEKVVLLEFFGICICNYAVSSADLDGRTVTSTSFFVDLPPFLLWIHFPLVGILLDLFKKIEHFEKSNVSKEFVSGAIGAQQNSFFVDGDKSNTPTYITTVPSRASLQGKIILPQGRIILCFPSEYEGDIRNSTSLEKFIILEHVPSSGSEKESDTFPLSAKANSLKTNPSMLSTSLHFGIGDFDIYLVDFEKKYSVGDKYHSLDRKSSSAIKILSGTNNRGDHHSEITMIWQKGPVTGPWMASRAWSLASSHDQHRNKVAGKSCEFSSATRAHDSQETSSHIRQELILSSAFFLHVHFSHVSVNLSNRDYKLLNHLLDQVSNGLCNGTFCTETINGDTKDERNSPSVGDASQASVLVDCDVLSLSVVLDEVVEVNNSIQKELEGSWNSLRLIVEKLELLSVSNIGGVNDATFFWLSHGEGELWGSVSSRNENTQDLLLTSCRNSAVKRGNGEGTNALSFGSAGTTVLNLWNPKLLQSYTSIVVRCGTIIAPGGRLDWINAICLFFGSADENDVLDDDGVQMKSSVYDTANKKSFLLELVDVALSYEPYVECSTCNVEFIEETGGQYVACLLAAASLSLSIQTMANSETMDYNIELQDVGLLLCESFGLINNHGGHYVSHLRKAGYVRVAQVALVEAVLRINGLIWEIDCSDSHINLDTCHDTTNGMFRLVAQLQQLYAPDMEEAVAHLQSRWNTIQQTHDDNISSDVADKFDNSVRLSSEKLPTRDDEGISVGLLDEILENAFNLKEECKPRLGHCNMQSHSSLEVGILDERDNIATSTHLAGHISSLNPSCEESTSISGMENTQQLSTDKTCLPQFIESYYISEFLPPSKLTVDNHAPDDHKCKLDGTGRRDMQRGKGGWYTDDSLKIVENHISKISNQPGRSPFAQKDKSWSDDQSPAESSRQKGRILLKKMDVRWRMYAGLDWCRLRNDSMSSSHSHGRDESKYLELTLSGLNIQYGIYPDGEIIVSKLSVSVQDFHLYDRSRDAPWTMMLGYYSSKNHPRESFAKAFKLDLEVVRPDPLTPIEDYRLLLEFLPIRLHLDQGQLNFLISFFDKVSCAEESPSLLNDTEGSEMAGRKSKTVGSQTIVEEALLPFFQKCIVKPVIVCVDYIPRHIDLAALRMGNYAELLNLVPWKGIDLHLKQVCALGIYGWSSVCETVVGQWLEDISHNQVHKLLKGLAPIRSLIAVSSGTSKLVSLPVKSYKKDQKFLKGMQRGAIAFLKSISLEAVGLGVHVAAGAHEMLLRTEYILTSIPPSPAISERSRTKTTVKSNQPEDAQQGIHQAYESLSDGLGRTASALIGTPLKVYQHGAGAGSALATALRSAPAAAIAPVTASARAVHCTLLGVRNSLDPEHKKESMEKYLGSSQP